MGNLADESLREQFTKLEAMGLAANTPITPAEVGLPASALYGGRGLRPIAEIQADLKKPIPLRFLSYREDKGGLTYWEWWVGVRFFDHYAPGWSIEFTQLNISNSDHVAIAAKLYVPCAECPYPGFFRSSTGGDYEHKDPAKRSIGFDPVLDAERQAMKRAMSNWGFGFELYVPDEDKTAVWKIPTNKEGTRFKTVGKQA